MPSTSAARRKTLAASGEIPPGRFGEVAYTEPISVDGQDFLHHLDSVALVFTPTKSDDPNLLCNIYRARANASAPVFCEALQSALDRLGADIAYLTDSTYRVEVRHDGEGLVTWCLEVALPSHTPHIVQVDHQYRLIALDDREVERARRIQDIRTLAANRVWWLMLGVARSCDT